MDGADNEDLLSDLTTACQQGDVETLQEIFEQPTCATSIDLDVGEGFTLLHLATAGGHENVVRLLLMRGAMLDCRNSYGWTPLMQAASYGHTHIVALLLQNKVDLNAKNKLGASALTLATLGGHLSVVRTLVDHPGIDLNDSQNSGQSLTPVMAAAVCGYRSILKLLTERGSTQCHPERSTGWTVLMMASLGGSHGAASLILKGGADPNAVDVNQRTALEIAVMQDNNRIKELLEGKTNNKIGVASLERMRIFKATEAGDENLVKELLAEDPSLCNSTSREGATPLMIAAMLGHHVIAEVLVHKGASINCQDRKNGWTALMQATFHRQLEMVKYLVEAGADTTIQAADGCTALDLALVIVNSDTEKVGDKLINLLASQEIPSEQELANGSLKGIPPVTSAEDDFLRGGLKAWWSRMSNRFQNLKLTRTLRAGFVSTKIASIEDSTDSLDKTLCPKGQLPTPNVKGGQHMKSKSVEFNLGNNTRRNSHHGETQLSISTNIQPESFIEGCVTMPTVIPPFLPSTAFEFSKTDRRRPHSHNNMKTKRQSLSHQRSSLTQRSNKVPNTLLFTRRSASMRTVHSTGALSPTPSGNDSTLRNGRVTSGHLGSLASFSGRNKVTRIEPSGTARNDGWTSNGKTKPSDELARYQKFRSVGHGSASSTSSTLSGSTKNPARQNIRRINPMGTASSSSTLTPPPSPIMEDDSPLQNNSKTTAEDTFRHTAGNPKSTDKLAALLERLSLGRYTETFRDQEVDMDLFLTLDDSDLREMGIDGSRDRNELMKAIRELNTRQSVKR